MELSFFLLIMALLFTKHFVCDFLLQGPYQYKNKGEYGHPGGLIHAAYQSVGTYAVLITYVSWVHLVVACLVEFAIHYHIDWAKINLNRRWNLTPVNSDYYFWMLGADQYLHYLTYLLIVYMVF